MEYLLLDITYYMHFRQISILMQTQLERVTNISQFFLFKRFYTSE